MTRDHFNPRMRSESVFCSSWTSEPLVASPAIVNRLLVPCSWMCCDDEYSLHWERILQMLSNRLHLCVWWWWKCSSPEQDTITGYL